MLRLSRLVDPGMRFPVLRRVRTESVLLNAGHRFLATTSALASGKKGSARARRVKQANAKLRSLPPGAHRKAIKREKRAERAERASESEEATESQLNVPESHLDIESLQNLGAGTNAAQLHNVFFGGLPTSFDTEEGIDRVLAKSMGSSQGISEWTTMQAKLSNPTLQKGKQQLEVRKNKKEVQDDVEEMEAAEETEESKELSTPWDPAADEEEEPSKWKKSSTKKAKAKAAPNVQIIRPSKLKLNPVEEDAVLSVPKVCHGLDRVLFNPGVYQIQDPRSRVFNFDPYLTSIMPVDEFDFGALKEYITSSKDVKLRQLSAAHGKKYCGSTSSLTSILSHFHFLLSQWRKPCLNNLSGWLSPESSNYTILSRGPAAAYARLSDGVYAIDSDKQYDTENVLSQLGKSMEKLLTLPKEEFEKYRRTRSHQLSEEEKNAEESYHYTTLGDFMLRSQLDAHDPRLPGTGMFDLKTRAVVSIRMDVRGYEKGVGYEIRDRFGQWESFEREYYDMIRSAFLKYSLQVRMGRMDGIFVAFHNTRRIFGFQYISLNEMDQAIHGSSDRQIGDLEFKASITLFNELLNKAAERFPGKSLRLHVETRPTKVPLTYFFAEPITEEEIDSNQEAGKPSVAEIEREIRDLSERQHKQETVESEESAQDETKDSEEAELSDGPGPQHIVADITWRTMLAKVDETIENESLGIGSVREAVQDALEQSGLLHDKSELETDQYLDSIVATLTARSAEIKSLRAKAKESTDESQESQEDAREGPSNTTGKDIAEVETPGDVDLSTEGTSLKDLILKVTERMEKKSEDLDEFQRIFADLAIQPRQPSPEEAEDAHAIEGVVGMNPEVEIGNAETAGLENKAEKPDCTTEVEAQEATTEEPETIIAEVESQEREVEESNATEAAEEDNEFTELEAGKSKSKSKAKAAKAKAKEEAKAKAKEKAEKKLKDKAERKAKASAKSEAAKVRAASKELLGMYVTIRNKVNGEYVERPTGKEGRLDWSIQYAIEELPSERATKIYTSLKKRRKEVLLQDPKIRALEWHRMFQGNLPIVTKRGEKFRERRIKEEANNPIHVAWDEVPLPAETFRAVPEELLAQEEMDEDDDDEVEESELEPEVEEEAEEETEAALEAEEQEDPTDEIEVEEEAEATTDEVEDQATNEEKPKPLSPADNSDGTK